MLCEINPQLELNDYRIYANIKQAANLDCLSFG